MPGGQTAGQRRARQLVLFAFLLGAGFLLLLLHAPRAGALELPTPSVELNVPVPTVPAVSGVSRVPPTPAHVQLPSIKVAVAPRAAVTVVPGNGSTRPHNAPPAANLSGPGRVDATTARPPTPLSGATAKPPVRGARSPRPAGTPAAPFTPAPSAPSAPSTAPATTLARDGQHPSPAAAFLAAAIALLVPLPVGTVRARRLRLPQLAFTPLARPG